MTAITWDDIGERYFETGVDRGVFYTTTGKGVAWNGLKAVNETPSGGEAVPYYIDGVKYLNVAPPGEFGGSIEAYTYPDEFVEYDGTTELYDGFYANLQHRKSFGLSYRTRVGNDLEGDKYGYKLHIIYNLLATPSTNSRASLNSSLIPMSFSWSFTTTPVKITDRGTYTAHVVLDSTKVSPGMLRVVENQLYGTHSRSPALMSMDKLMDWFELGGEPLMIIPDYTTGMSRLVTAEEGDFRDLVTTDEEGINIKPASGSRFVSHETGYNVLD